MIDAPCSLSQDGQDKLQKASQPDCVLVPATLTDGRFSDQDRGYREGAQA